MDVFVGCLHQSQLCSGKVPVLKTPLFESSEIVGATPFGQSTGELDFANEKGGSKAWRSRPDFAIQTRLVGVSKPQQSTQIVTTRHWPFSCFDSCCNGFSPCFYHQPLVRSGGGSEQPTHALGQCVGKCAGGSRCAIALPLGSSFDGQGAYDLSDADVDVEWNVGL